MSARTNAGSKIFIGPAVADVGTATAMSLSALSGYVEIDELMDLNEIGDTASEVTYSTLNNRRVQRLKGQFDGGTPAFVFGRDWNDPGQKAMRAAFRSDSNYAFKITRDDDEVVDFFCGLVMGEREGYSTADNIITANFTVSINSEVFHVET